MTHVLEIAMKSNSLLAVVLSVVTAAAAIAQDKSKPEPKAPAGVTWEKDIVFGKGGDTDLHLDLARPKDAAGPLPCIVVNHGGGWRGGNFKVHVPQIFDFAKSGFVSATVQYRLVPSARWPAQIEDMKCAVRHLRANADKYGIAKDRFGAIGFSAGAHLSMLLGTMDDKDRLVPYNQAYELADAMTTAGLGGRVELLLGADHGWGNPEMARTSAASLAFFNHHLKK